MHKLLVDHLMNIVKCMGLYTISPTINPRYYRVYSSTFAWFGDNCGVFSLTFYKYSKIIQSLWEIFLAIFKK